MTILHHPSDETLAAFAGANLDEGNSIVVATHLAHCEACRKGVRHFQAVAGALLESGDLSEVDSGMRNRVIEAIGKTEQLEEMPASQLDNHKTANLTPLSLYDSGKWRWIGVGVQWKPVHLPSEGSTRVFMLKSAPGTRLPDHRHVGTEWTCVLQGAFTHHVGRFGPGDFDEADDSVEHDPYVEREGECICLVALNGHIELRSWIGRLIQPFVRI